MIEPVSDEELGRTWWCVGRFMWSFAVVESVIDGILQTLFNLSATAQLLLFPQLDLRKKLALVELGLKRQGMDVRQTINRVQRLHDIRNVIAHSSFGPDGDGHGNSGVNFDYVNKKGELQLPKFSGRASELAGWDTGITYEEFDDIDADVRDLWDVLRRLEGSCVSLRDFDIEADSEFGVEIRQALSLPHNVIEFPKRLERNPDEQT
jgi:hypothetical protein